MDNSHSPMSWMRHNQLVEQAKDDNQDDGTKFDDEKVRVDLLPPDALWEIARVLTFGAKKYDAWNWYKGISYSRLFGAAMRHLWQWWRGMDNDAESGLSHLAHAGCCLLFMLQQVVERRTDKDDRVQWKDQAKGLGVSLDGKYSSHTIDIHANDGDLVIYPTTVEEVEYETVAYCTCDGTTLMCPYCASRIGLR